MYALRAAELSLFHGGLGDYDKIMKIAFPKKPTFKSVDWRIMARARSRFAADNGLRGCNPKLLITLR